jgi:steroid 5-alpha reductase family enzyme
VNHSFGDLVGDLWPVLLACLAAAVVLQLVTFAVGLRVHRLSVVDVTWGASFALIAVVGWLVSLPDDDASTLRRALIVVLTVIWGGRLAVHIGRRQRGAPEDPRYTEMMSKATGNPTWAALRSVFLLQAVAAWFISLPLQFALVDAGGAGPLLWVGVLLWAVGFFFESVGDAQLTRFKADPASRGQVMDSGLWRYTRHPNYFGDACVWWGLFLIAADAGWSWLTLLSPLLMTWFLAAKTGKPLMEKQLSKSRPGYAEYVERTSGFIPRPPHRPSPSSDRSS